MDQWNSMEVDVNIVIILTAMVIYFVLYIWEIKKLLKSQNVFFSMIANFSIAIMINKWYITPPQR